MIRSAESENWGGKKRMSAVLNISPLKWKLSALLYPAAPCSEGFSSISMAVCAELNEYLNVLYVNFIQTRLVFSLFRGGLQLSDISGAAYSQ